MRHTIARTLIRTGYYLGEADFWQRRWGRCVQYPHRSIIDSCRIEGDATQVSKANDPAWRVNWRWQLLQGPDEFFHPLCHLKSGWWCGPWLPVRTPYVAVRIGPLGSFWICRTTAGDTVVPKLDERTSKPLSETALRELISREGVSVTLV